MSIWHELARMRSEQSSRCLGAPAPVRHRTQIRAGHLHARLAIVHASCSSPAGQQDGQPLGAVKKPAENPFRPAPAQDVSVNALIQRAANRKATLSEAAARSVPGETSGQGHKNSFKCSKCHRVRARAGSQPDSSAWLRCSLTRRAVH